jgi:hypothetical protein
MLGLGMAWSWSMFGIQVASKMAALGVLAFVGSRRYLEAP